MLEYGADIIQLVGCCHDRWWGGGLEGMGVGANYEEAQAGESREDFVHKLQVALKELRESNCWLRLLAKAKVVPPERLFKLIDESTQLIAMLSKSVATAKGKARSVGV